MGRRRSSISPVAVVMVVMVMVGLLQAAGQVQASLRGGGGGGEREEEVEVMQHGRDITTTTATTTGRRAFHGRGGDGGGGGEERFDYIVVGAGNAGAVVAARLSQDLQVTVLLLEEGTFSQDGNRGDDDGDGDGDGDWVVDQIRTPHHDYRTWALPQLTNQIWTEPNAALHNRSGILLGPVVTGKALGGSTVVNIGAYTRPEPAYFDRWQLPRWSAQEVLPYFKKLEDHENPDTSTYGKGGPVHVELGEAQTLTPLLHEASLSMAPPLTACSSGHDYTGLPQVYRVLKGGHRVDAYTAYLRQAMLGGGGGGGGRRSNLMVRTGARVHRVVMEEAADGGSRAVGVEYCMVDQGGYCGKDSTMKQAYVWKEVVLCGGVFFTPHLLLKSGIGPRQGLQALGIKVHSDLPGVGSNLLARTNTLFFFGNGSVVPEMDPHVVLGEEASLLFEEEGRGPLSLGALGVYTVIKDRRGGHGQGQTDYIMLMTDVIPMVAFRMFALGCANLRVNAGGWLKLEEHDPLWSRYPRINLNMLASQTDRQALKRCLRDVRDLMGQPTMAKLGYQEVFPTRSLVDDTDEALDRWLSTGYTFYSWHATGTAKMGHDDDSMAVLDHRLRVRGVHGLRVADASAFPDMIEAGPMAAIYMMGERAADFIKQDNNNNHTNHHHDE